MKSLLACACVVLAIVNVVLALDDDGFEASLEKDGEQVRIAALTAATTSDPANCRLLYTDDLIEQMTGESGTEAMELCEESEREQDDEGATGEVTLGEFEGATAFASVRVDGDVPWDGATVEMELTYEYNLWRVNRIVSVDVDREAFDRYMRLDLIDSRYSPVEADCILGVWQEISEEELEAAMVVMSEPPSQLDEEKAARCISAESKRRIVARIVAEAGRERGEDEYVIECVSDRLRQLPLRVAAEAFDQPEDEAKPVIQEAILACRDEADSLNDA